jgi:hypothetical protein
MKKKNKYKVLYVFLLCVFLLSTSNNVLAQSKGSVQLKASVDNNGNIVGEPIVGAVTAPDQIKALQALIDQAISD